MLLILNSLFFILDLFYLILHGHFIPGFCTYFSMETETKEIENKNFPNQPWEPVSGFDKGAWKITNNKSGN